MNNRGTDYFKAVKFAQKKTTTKNAFFVYIKIQHPHVLRLKISCRHVIHWRFLSVIFMRGHVNSHCRLSLWLVVESA